MKYFKLCKHLYFYDGTSMLGYYEYIDGRWQRELPPLENMDLEEISEEEFNEILQKKYKESQEEWKKKKK